MWNESFEEMLIEYVGRKIKAAFQGMIYRFQRPIRGILMIGDCARMVPVI